MLLVSTGATLAEKVSKSDAPWIYLAVILILALLYVGWRIFSYLTKLDQQHRDESKEREKNLMTHLERSNDLHERSTLALESVGTSMKMMEGRMDRMEKHVFHQTNKNEGGTQQWNS